MRQSELFTKISREAPKEEVSANSQLLIGAGFIDKLMAGVYSFLPLGLRVMAKIENIIREEINAIGGQEVLMPSLHPRNNWLTTGRWDTMRDLFKINDESGTEMFALGATHEEIIVPLVKKYVNSYKDLPLYVYQIQNKFRRELRAKSGLLRGREFIMKDLYSFHLSEEDLSNYYEKVKDAYVKIFKKTGIWDKTYLTFASGGSFSKYSQEFQTVSEGGEDIIHVCKKCNQAVNKEIFEGVCPNCQAKDFEEKKAIEVGNIFKLKNKYSKPFDLTVADKDGVKKEVVMGCYGIGLSRLMGAIVEINYDDKGIIWPKEVAPFSVHLIRIGDSKKAEKAAEKVYRDLQKKGIEVLYDDRDKSPGEKFAEADLIGIPLRLVVSERTLQKSCAEVKERGKSDFELVKISSLLKKISNFYAK